MNAMGGKQENADSSDLSPKQRLSELHQIVRSKSCAKQQARQFRKCSISFSFYFRILLLLFVYVYIIVHILKAGYLHNLSEKILRDNTDNLTSPKAYRFPSRCKPYMKNCARVSFDTCEEIKTDRHSFDCVFLDRCAQMSDSYSLGDQVGMNVSTFFANSVKEVETQAIFCGQINFPTQFEMKE